MAALPSFCDNGGTTDTQAGFATDAFFVDRDGSLVLYIFQKGARTAGDHDETVRPFKFLGDGFSVRSSISNGSTTLNTV